MSEVAPFSYAQATHELENLLARLETGELALEEALELHRHGLELLAQCRAYLTQAEQELQQLADGPLGPELRPIA